MSPLRTVTLLPQSRFSHPASPAVGSNPPYSATPFFSWKVL